MPRKRSLSFWLYRGSRASRDAEVLASDHRPRISQNNAKPPLSEPEELFSEKVRELFSDEALIVQATNRPVSPSQEQPVLRFSLGDVYYDVPREVLREELVPDFDSLANAVVQELNAKAGRV